VLDDLYERIREHSEAHRDRLPSVPCSACARLRQRVAIVAYPCLDDVALDPAGYADDLAHPPALVASRDKYTTMSKLAGTDGTTNAVVTRRSARRRYVIA